MADEPRRNIPVPDELWEVRDRIKQLKEREEELKQILLADPDTRTGSGFAAEIQEVTTARLDVKELRAAYPAQVSEHTFPVKTTRILLREISEDGELLPSRRKARA